MIRIDKPLFVLSKKYYAGGEVTIEFLIRENKETNVNMFLTLKDKEVAEQFKLGKEYEISFKEKEKTSE